VYTVIVFQGRRSDELAGGIPKQAEFHSRLSSVAIYSLVCITAKQQQLERPFLLTSLLLVRSCSFCGSSTEEKQDV